MSIYNPGMILAGDIGGTKTLIGLFASDRRRPVPVDVRAFATRQYSGLPAILREFFDAQRSPPKVTSVAFGVAGPVIDQHAEMTNVEWQVNATELSEIFGFQHIQLLNDLESMAYSLPVLTPDELSPIKAGEVTSGGTVALIAAGTGLGEALLHHAEGRYVPIPSEGGHCDFPARTDDELAFMRYLRDRYGRAEIEHVLSGPGLLNLSDFTHQDGSCAALAAGIPEKPADVSNAALANRCGRCGHALHLFVDAYGAASGNLALTAVTTGGVYLGGGIAPKILPALQNGRFAEAFLDKGPMRPLLETIPVHVILNPKAALLGAAVYANAANVSR